MTETRLPYDDPEYADGHDADFHADPANAVHSRFELGMIEELAGERSGLSWLNVACGTGFHLANAGGHMRRTGVDRAEAMLEVARRRPGRAATFHCRDARDLSALGSFDLVARFWCGCVHQESVDEVPQPLSSMASAVAPGGDFLLGVCGPAGGLGNMPRAVRPPFGRGTMRIDAVVRRHSERGRHECRDCIAPHPKLVLAALAPRLEERRWRDCPRSAARPGWQREALHLRRPTGSATQ